METNISHFKSLLQLIDYFRDENTCREYLAAQRWGSDPSCPHCASTSAYVTNRGYKCSDSGCAKKFSVTNGTIFENTKIKLRYWYAAIYLATAHKKGISSLQLSRDINVTQKTAWFMLHRIREMLNANSTVKMGGFVEADETYVGGNLKNKSNSVRKRYNDTQNPFMNKTTVMAMVERGGMVIAKKLDVTSARSIDLLPMIRESVTDSAVIITDGAHAYRSLKKTHEHHIVNHAQGEYKRGIYHTNTIEGFFSHLKRGIIGIYHYVSPKHLGRYVNEFSFRYNERHVTDCNRFDGVFGNVNRRLTYKMLIS